MSTLLKSLAHWGFAGVMLIAAPVIFIGLRLLDIDIDLAAALALGLPSLIYAAVQFNAANGTTDRLVQLELQLSTRRLDEAPHFLCDIVDLLDKERGKIWIFCDFPAYGAISGNPEHYTGYVQAIHRRAEDSTVEMLCLDNEIRQSLARDGYIERPKLKEQYPTVDSFLEKVEQENSQAESDHVLAGVKVRQTSLVMPLYFWVGKREAIFSLRRFTGERMVEIGFKTSDRPLIEALQGIFDHYQAVDEKNSQP